MSECTCHIKHEITTVAFLHCLQRVWHQQTQATANRLSLKRPKPLTAIPKSSQIYLNLTLPAEWSLKFDEEHTSFKCIFRSCCVNLLLSQTHACCKIPIHVVAVHGAWFVLQRLAPELFGALPPGRAARLGPATLKKLGSESQHLA